MVLIQHFFKPGSSKFFWGNGYYFGHCRESSVPHKRWVLLCGAPSVPNIWLTALVRVNASWGDLVVLFVFKLLMIKIFND